MLCFDFLISVFFLCDLVFYVYDFFFCPQIYVKKIIQITFLRKYKDKRQFFPSTNANYITKSYMNEIKFLKCTRWGVSDPQKSMKIRRKLTPPIHKTHSLALTFFAKHNDPNLKYMTLLYSVVYQLRIKQFTMHAAVKERDTFAIK